MFSSVPYAKLFSSVSRYSSDASENRIARMNSRTPDICVEGLIVVDPCKPRLPVDRDYQCSFAVVFTQFRAGISCRRVDRIERHVLAARGGTQAWIEFDVSTAMPVYKLKRNRPIASKREENGIERITTELRTVRSPMDANSDEFDAEFEIALDSSQKRLSRSIGSSQESIDGRPRRDVPLFVDDASFQSLKTFDDERAAGNDS